MLLILFSILSIVHSQISLVQDLNTNSQGTFVWGSGSFFQKANGNYYFYGLNDLEYKWWGLSSDIEFYKASGNTVTVFPDFLSNFTRTYCGDDVLAYDPSRTGYIYFLDPNTLTWTNVTSIACGYQMLAHNEYENCFFSCAGLSSNYLINVWESNANQMTTISSTNSNAIYGGVIQVLGGKFFYRAYYNQIRACGISGSTCSQYAADAFPTCVTNQFTYIDDAQMGKDGYLYLNNAQTLIRVNSSLGCENLGGTRFLSTMYSGNSKIYFNGNSCSLSGCLPTSTKLTTFDYATNIFTGYDLYPIYLNYWVGELANSITYIDGGLNFYFWNTSMGNSTVKIGNNSQIFRSDGSNIYFTSQELSPVTNINGYFLYSWDGYNRVLVNWTSPNTQSGAVSGNLITYNNMICFYGKTGGYLAGFVPTCYNPSTSNFQSIISSPTFRTVTQAYNLQRKMAVAGNKLVFVAPQALACAHILQTWDGSTVSTIANCANTFGVFNDLVYWQDSSNWVYNTQSGLSTLINIPFNLNAIPYGIGNGAAAVATYGTTMYLSYDGYSFTTISSNLTFTAVEMVNGVIFAITSSGVATFNGQNFGLVSPITFTQISKIVLHAGKAYWGAYISGPPYQIFVFDGTTLNTVTSTSNFVTSFGVNLNNFYFMDGKVMKYYIPASNTTVTMNSTTYGKISDLVSYNGILYLINRNTSYGSELWKYVPPTQSTTGGVVTSGALTTSRLSTGIVRQTTGVSGSTTGAASTTGRATTGSSSNGSTTGNGSSNGSTTGAQTTGSIGVATTGVSNGSGVQTTGGSSSGAGTTGDGNTSETESNAVVLGIASTLVFVVMLI